MNARRSQSGFVLVATIWLSLIVFVLAGIFNFYASQQLERAIASKERIQEQLDISALLSTLLFTVSTSGMDRSGVVLEGEHLRLDGTVYRGFGDLFFSVNDQAGLVGLNPENNLHLENLLRAFETDGLKRSALLNSLADYIDLDQRPRLGGREAAAYRVASLPAPTNEYLKSVRELNQVYGWDEWLTEHPEFESDHWLSTNWRSRLNVNSAPEPLLRQVLPLSTTAKQELIERRRKQPFGNSRDLNSVTRLLAELDEDFYTFFPIHELRFRIFSGNNLNIYTIIVFFNPMSMTAPWEIDHRYQIERNFEIRKPAGTLASSNFDR